MSCVICYRRLGSVKGAPRRRVLGKCLKEASNLFAHGLSGCSQLHVLLGALICVCSQPTGPPGTPASPARAQRWAPFCSCPHPSQLPLSSWQGDLSPVYHPLWYKTCLCRCGVLQISSIQEERLAMGHSPSLGIGKGRTELDDALPLRASPTRWHPCHPCTTSQWARGLWGRHSVEGTQHVL